jgi:[glutamine synthetase] adenylyltransferase / [glutamine synthetase]-adenylyl-L-tyrosine phosphorylase
MPGLPMNLDSPLPEPAAARAVRSREQLADAGIRLDDLPARALERVLAASDFVADALRLEPGLRERILSPTYRNPGPELERLPDADQRSFVTELRRLRRRVLADLAWRDICGSHSLDTTLAALSAFADGAIRAALHFSESSLAHRYGTARGSDGGPLPLVVVAMGKLGGGELNFSSDIDLIFLFAEHGTTDGPRRIDFEEYYTRIGQTLIQLLDSVTADGFVFRVDLRLRPFGESGAPVSSFAALEDYLQTHGRDWERYAWVKARPVTGAQAYATLFREVIRPFVFRRYLDFGVFESLRAMKALIESDVARSDRADDVKLGPGGIRELEFIVQAFQLLRGGSDRRLQNQSLLAVLPLLAGQKLLSEPTVSSLESAYRYLRAVENRLQMVADRQTHALPNDEDARARLAAALGLGSWAEVHATLSHHRDAVASCFRAFVAPPAATGADPVLDLDALWQGTRVEALAQSLSRQAIADAPALAELLAQTRDGTGYRRLDAPGQQRLQALLPALVRGVAQKPAPAATLSRVLDVVAGIGTRTSYLALLLENPLALDRLLEICAMSAFLPGQIAKHPLLLDELIDQRLFDEPPTRAQFAADIALRAALEPGQERDPEHEVEVLRQVQRAAIFRIALFDLTGRLPLMQVSDRLTDVAELILEQAMAHAWREVAAQYGAPRCGRPDDLKPCGIVAIGYGKLGGYELGYASDLDLVFLHDSAGEVQQTAGPKVVDNGVFFLRLGQKILHLLTVHTAAGRLYEVDTRLRPSGKGGFLVTNIEAFAEYQKSEAWTWEHQALLHSRAVAGDSALAGHFETIRQEVLCGYVDRQNLRQAVTDMRARMRRELARGSASDFDLKQDSGGTADIEFLAQYWVLRDCPRYPALVTFSDTIRQLESVGSAALIDHAVIDDLVEAYREYRSLIHRLSLEGRPLVVPATPLAPLRARVTAIWEAHLGQDGAAAPRPSGHV